MLFYSKKKVALFAYGRIMILSVEGMSNKKIAKKLKKTLDKNDKLAIIAT